jgi:hypothetical protein
MKVLGPLCFGVTLLLFSSSLAFAQYDVYSPAETTHLNRPGVWFLTAGVQGTVPSSDSSDSASASPQIGGSYGINSWWTVQGSALFNTDSQSSVLDAAAVRSYFKLGAGGRFTPIIDLALRVSSDPTVVTAVGPAGVTYTTTQQRYNPHGIGEFLLVGEVHDWLLQGTITAGKNMSTSDPFRFSYIADALHRRGTSDLSRLNLGARAFGGLGSTDGFVFAQGGQYLGPFLSWQASPRNTVYMSASFGYTHSANRVLFGLYFTRMFGRAR